MKVFVSSTCYDLLDLRAELHQDLRDLGVEPLFSELKESDFVVPAAPDVNSIEACLANLREADVVIVILSQRYGPNLGAAFGNVSATHCEYSEARRLQKPIYFYVRDRLDGDHGAWRRNGSRDDFTGAWCGKDGTKGLFAMIDEHRKLVGPEGAASSNNWFSLFTNSVDLRADLRRRLEPDAFRATGEKLIRAGQVPILLVVAQGLTRFDDGQRAASRPFRFEFTVVNAGAVAAISVQGDLVLRNFTFGGNESRAGAVLPGQPGNPVRITFDIPHHNVMGLFADEKATCSLCFGYSTPSGHVMRDHFDVNLVRRGDDIQFLRLPDYGGKTIAGMKQYLKG